MLTAPGAATPLKCRSDQTRRLVLVDIENLVGGAIQEAASVSWARARLAGAIGHRVNDLVVIGTCHRGLLTVGTTWTRVRYVVGSGPDGADLALLDVMGEQVADRFSEVVLASGDGIFAESVAGLGARGVKVVVVAHPDGLARRLKLAAAECVLLSERWNARSGDYGDAA